MADALSLRRCLVAASTAAAASSALALGQSAPFQPPRASAVASTSAAATMDSAEGIAGVALHRQPLALIDGQWRRVGDEVRGARLSAIDTRGAWLIHDDGRRERLWLAPPISSPDAAASRPGHRKAQR